MLFDDDDWGTAKVNDDCRRRMFSDCNRETTSRKASFSCTVVAFLSSSAATLSSNYFPEIQRQALCHIGYMGIVDSTYVFDVLLFSFSKSTLRGTILLLAL